MVFFMHILILGLLATFGLADLDPKYQKPQTVTAVSYAGIEPNSCDASSFNVLPGKADIVSDDCASISNGWIAEGDFVLLSTHWVNSTGDADHFYSKFGLLNNRMKSLPSKAAVDTFQSTRRRAPANSLSSELTACRMMFGEQTFFLRSFMRDTHSGVLARTEY